MSLNFRNISGASIKAGFEADGIGSFIGHAMAQALITYRNKGATPEQMDTVAPHITRYNDIVLSSEHNPEIYCSGGRMQVEEGTVIFGENKTWSHTVTMADKNIRLRKGRQRPIYFEVVKKEPPPRIPAIVPSTTPGKINITGHYAIEPWTEASLMLDDAYSCKSVNIIPAWISNFNVNIQVGYPLGDPRYPRDSLGNVSKEENVALETLREMITEAVFRKYLKYGYVVVKGASGDYYQIFRNRSHTRVWRGGKIIEEVCVRIADTSIPATDSVIAFITMIKASEEDFKKSGNVYKLARAA